MRLSTRLPSLPNLLALLALLALGTLPSSALPSAAQAEPVRAKEAGLVPKPRVLEFPVTGLATENSTTVRTDLLALQLTVHRCKVCEKEQAEPGACHGCQGSLEAKTRPLFTAVAPSTASSLLALTADPMATVRLSEIETVLTARSVRIDDERFTLAGCVQLLVSNPPTEATAVERALKEAKLFAEVKVEPEPSGSQLVLTVSSDAKPPSRAKVTAALQGAKARLVDVLWRPTVPRS